MDATYLIRVIARGRYFFEGTYSICYTSRIPSKDYFWVLLGLKLLFRLHRQMSFKLLAYERNLFGREQKELRPPRALLIELA